MLKIMIVDDEQIVREGLKFTIRESFSDTLKIVGEARNGREALELCEERKPDIVLMDIQMPGINGIETIKKIKDIHSNTKFIIVSALIQAGFTRIGIAKTYIHVDDSPTHSQKLIWLYS